jgi:hypothetical protein
LNNDDIKHCRRPPPTFLPTARTGREQFFDLEKDPTECSDLAASPDRSEEICTWRQRLVNELSAREGMTDKGALVVQTETIVLPFRDTPRT